MFAEELFTVEAELRKAAVDLAHATGNQANAARKALRDAARAYVSVADGIDALGAELLDRKVAAATKGTP